MTFPPTEAEKAAFRADLLRVCGTDGPVARAVRLLELEAMASAPSETQVALTKHCDLIPRETTLAEVERRARSPHLTNNVRWLDRTAPND